MNNLPKINDLDLDFVKNYLRVDYDFDDNLIDLMIISAKSFIQSYLNQKFEDYGDELPYEFTIAGLTLISEWYEKRNIQSAEASQKELAYSFGGILDQYRNWNHETVNG